MEGDQICKGFPSAEQARQVINSDGRRQSHQDWSDGQRQTWILSKL